MNQILQDAAKSLGFLDGGWTSDLGPTQFETAYDEYLDRGWEGDMAYLRRTAHLRKNPQAFLPWAHGVAILIDGYGNDDVTPDASATIAAYARLSEDYHDSLRPRAEALARVAFPEDATTRVFIDTAPLLERELAVRAGLGFIGKNGLLIHPQFGSKFFIVIVASDRSPFHTLRPERFLPSMAGCGTCTACLDQCPTSALEEPHRLNPTRCISYWTIESKAPFIPDSIREKQGGWIYGCDVCQDVCPWNRFSKPGFHSVDPLKTGLSHEKISKLHEADAYFAFRGKGPLKRLSFAKWLRNIFHFSGPEVRSSL